VKQLESSVGRLTYRFRLIDQKFLQFMLIDEAEEQNFAAQNPLHEPGFLDHMAFIFWTFGGVSMPPRGSLSDDYERKYTN